MLRFYTAGESHGQALLAFISGLPAQMPVDQKFINHELRRRQLGYGRGGRQKIEKDTAEIFAGVRHGKTIGAPIALRIENRDWANWEKILRAEARGAAPRPRRSCGIAEIQLPRCALYSGASFGAGNRCTRGGRCLCKTAFAGIRHANREPYDSGGARAPGKIRHVEENSGGERGPRFSIAMYRRRRAGKNESGGGRGAESGRHRGRDL